MKQIKPISTNIQQLIIIDDFIIIREDSSDFNGTSNIYCHNGNEVIWYAELPNTNDYYSNDIIISEGKVFSSTWDGWTVELNTNTGKIITKKFTK